KRGDGIVVVLLLELANAQIMLGLAGQRIFGVLLEEALPFVAGQFVEPAVLERHGVSILLDGSGRRLLSLLSGGRPGQHEQPEHNQRDSAMTDGSSSDLHVEHLFPISATTALRGKCSLSTRRDKPNRFIIPAATGVYKKMTHCGEGLAGR